MSEYPKFPCDDCYTDVDNVVETVDCHSIKQWKQRFVAQLKSICEGCNSRESTYGYCLRVCKQRVSPRELLEAFTE